jgi:hypothetical protein
VYGWVDVLIAAAAALVVARWMPSSRPAATKRARR